MFLKQAASQAQVSSLRLNQWRFFCDFIRTVPKYIVPEESVRPKKKVFEMTKDEIAEQLKENLKQLRKDFAKDESNDIVVPVFKKAFLHADQIAVKDSQREYSYIQLYVSAKKLGYQISNLCGSAAQFNVAYICSNNILSHLTQWACWMSGQVAMPLNKDVTLEELKVLFKEAKPRVLIVSKEYESVAQKLSSFVDSLMLVIDHTFMEPPTLQMIDKHRLLLPGINAVLVEGSQRNDFYNDANALLLYRRTENGTPRGVMLNHRSLDFQIRGLVNAWQMSSSDCLLHAQPLNNAYGFFGGYLAAMSVGAKMIMHEEFISSDVWNSLLSINAPSKDRVNVFFGVPAMYKVLIEEYDKTLGKKQSMMDYALKHCKEKVRLMVSGGAPLSQNTLNRWYAISGHWLLQCYGLADAGVVLSGKYVEVSKHKDEGVAGMVGLPLPDVRIRLVNKDAETVMDCYGEIENGKWVLKHTNNGNMDDNTIEKEDFKVAAKQTEKKPGDQSPTKANEFEKVSETGFRKEVTKIQLQFRENNAKPKRNDNFDLSIGLSKSGAPLVELNYKADNRFPSNEIIKNICDIFIAELEKKKTEEMKISETVEKSDDPTSDKPAEIHTKDPTEATNKVQHKPDGVKKVNEEQVSKSGDMNCKAKGVENIDAIREFIDEGIIGSLEISSPALFKEYYKDPESTAADFEDGFLKTGDLVAFQNDNFKLLKQSTIYVLDIAGQRVSNIDVESLLLEHPSIKDVSIIAMPSMNARPAYKNVKLGAVCVLHPNTKLDLNSLKAFCSKSLPTYLLPQWLKVVDVLPRSDLGEINRQKLLSELLHHDVNNTVGGNK